MICHQCCCVCKVRAINSHMQHSWLFLTQVAVSQSGGFRRKTPDSATSINVVFGLCMSGHAKNRSGGESWFSLHPHKYQIIDSTVIMSSMLLFSVPGLEMEGKP